MYLNSYNRYLIKSDKPPTKIGNSISNYETTFTCLPSPIQIPCTNGIRCLHATRKYVFSNRFRDRKISVTIETDLETNILNVNLKKIQSLYQLLHNYRDRIRDQ